MPSAKFNFFAEDSGTKGDTGQTQSNNCHSNGSGMQRGGAHAPPPRPCRSRSSIGEAKFPGIKLRLNLLFPALLARGNHKFLFLTLAQRAMLFLFCAVIPRGLAARIGAGRAEQTLFGSVGRMTPGKSSNPQGGCDGDDLTSIQHKCAIGTYQALFADERRRLSILGARVTAARC